MSVKALAGFLLPLYCVGMTAMAVGLSSYDWPEPQLAPAAITDGAPAPREEFEQVPPDFAAISDIAQRKQAFFDFFRPMIKEQNRQLAWQQKRLQQLAELAGERELTATELEWLEAMAETYAVAENEPHQTIERLLLKVNVIPEAMVLAQAASESAWGTSRFARQGNNYFGQWCYSQGCGLVPSRRMKGANHEVAAFESPYDSVKAYFHNINSHLAYREFRQLRRQRAEGEQPLTARALLPGLRRYSERGAEYIDELMAIIRHNKLARAVDQDG